jgi:uncharacterized repeat protein (TIGR03803 family)
MTSKRNTPATRIPTASVLFLSVFAVLIAFATSTPVIAQETVLYNFSSNGGDPYAGLTFDASGNLYGTTEFGTVFKLTPRAGGGWTEAVLYTFNGAGDADLYAGLILDASGNLYGTEYFGGTYGWGFVFELTPAKGGGTWTEKTLHSFSANGTDGTSPSAGLIFDTVGNLYGTTQSGGANGGGTVFELSPSDHGSWGEKILYNFIYNGTGAYEPVAGLIFDASGNLYGTTLQGGTYGAGNDHTGGTVFELTPSADGSWTETVLYNFDESGSGPYGPGAVLVLDPAGNLYSTTPDGGTYNSSGTVFELSPQAGGSWTETTLHSFGNGSDGLNPFDGLVLDASGNLYGTTWQGGAYGKGTAFELMPEAGGAWEEKVLYSFGGSGTDGKNPSGGLIFDASGNLYGTTQGGGAYGGGTVFEINPHLILTTTALVSSLNPSIYGQKLTWTATVTTSGKTTPTGKVNFNWGISSIGEATLNASGVATLTRSALNADTYPLTAVYSGDTTHAGSTSAIVNQVVQETTSAATLTSSLNPSTAGQAITFTATITSPTVSPTGPVTFSAGKTVLGSAQLSKGKASFTTSTLAVGPIIVTATYYGDSNIAKSSASVTQIVQP